MSTYQPVWVSYYYTKSRSGYTYIPVHASSSYLTVHEMHGRMHPNYCQITHLLVVDPLSSLVYPMMTHLLPVANKLPIKPLVAKQLPTNIHVVDLYLHVHVHVHNIILQDHFLLHAIVSLCNFYMSSRERETESILLYGSKTVCTHITLSYRLRCRHKCPTIFQRNKKRWTYCQVS